MASGLGAKRLGLLKEVVPRISRVLVLSYRVDPIAAPQVKELESAAHSLGVKLLSATSALPLTFRPRSRLEPRSAPKES